MGGTGNGRTDLDFVNSNYITLWGGAFGGSAWSISMFNRGIDGYYWSQSEDDDANIAFFLSFDRSGNIWGENHRMNKSYGATLRCVR